MCIYKYVAMGKEISSGQFKGLFKYRIGDYHVIYAKTRRGILILRIAHRSKTYK